MATIKVYDIRIDAGENAGCFRMGGIESKEVAERLMAEYWPTGCSIVEREKEVRTVSELLDDGAEDLIYFPDDGKGDLFFGNGPSVCLPYHELEWLAREWEMPIAEVLGQVHEATREEIESYGVAG